MQCSTALELYHTEKYILTWVCDSWQGPRATERSTKVQKIVGGKSSLQQSSSSRTDAAHPALPQPGFGTRDKTPWKDHAECNPLPLTCQKPGDASVPKTKLSSSCLLVLYCTSFACCYSKNRTDSSLLGTTAVNKTTQANSLLNIGSL